MNKRKYLRRMCGQTFLLAGTSLELMACSGQHEPAGEPTGTSQAALGIHDPTNGFFVDRGPPAISSRGANSLDVFKVSDGGQMYQRSVVNGGWEPTWRPLPPLQSPHTFGLWATIASVSWGSARIDVFARDELGDIVHNWSNDGSNWSPVWETIATISECVTDICEITAASWGVNRLDVMVLHATTPGSFDGNTTIKQITYDNGWQAPRVPFAIGNGDGYGFIKMSAVSWGPSHIDMVATAEQIGGLQDTGQREPVHYSTNDGVNWSGPEGLGLINGSAFPNGIALTTWGVNVLNVVSTGLAFQNGLTGLQVAQKPYRPTTGWSDWQVSQLQVDVSPYFLAEDHIDSDAVSWGPGRIDLLELGFNGAEHVTHAWSNESPPVGWFGWEVLSTITSPSCLDSWRSNPTCAPLCTSRTQSDQAACAEVLDCYQQYHCGPGTCDTGDDVCGPDQFSVGNAPYPFAQQVFDCIPGCP